MRFRSTWLAFGVLLAGCGGGERADWVVRGALVADGSGDPGRRLDVAVRGDRISGIGPSGSLDAARVIDATGLVLAPGFIDLHSHADLILLAGRERQADLLEAKIRQGVTTLIVGNCGLGPRPADAGAGELLADVNGWMTPDGVETGPGSIGAYLDTLERDGIVLNAGTLVPHGPVRMSSMGLAGGRPSDAELESMRLAVAAALDEGAFGLSVGLIYPPGMYSDTAELVALAREVAVRDRLFTIHVRGSSETLLDATAELVEIARSSGARVQHSHLEAVGERFWDDVGAVLEREDRARADGLDIAHDVFPYTRAATMMSAIFPPWSLEGGIPALLERLRDPALRERIRVEIETRRPEWPPWEPGGWPHNLVGAVGWDGILVASVGDASRPDWIGRNLAELGTATGQPPFDLVADLMLEQDGRVGQLVDEISGRGAQLDVLRTILLHPAAVVVSDAEDYGRGAPHPAHAGAFARALRWGLDAGIPLEQLVRRMTGLPAARLGLARRGIIRPGSFADLVLFDPNSVRDRADWLEPRAHAEGVRWVAINGRLVVEDGRFVGGAAGSVLRAKAHED